MRVRAIGWILLGYCMSGTAVEGADYAKAPADERLERHEFESKHMGTLFRVVLYTADKATAETASRAAFARVAELDAIMSDYNPNSELMRLCKANDTAPGKPAAVGAELFDVLQKAQITSKISGGSFDVTVGPVVRLWRLARRTQQLPDAKELAAALAKVGYEKIALDPAARTVALKVPGMRLDLGGIAKGYAADAALALLKEKFGITRALVAASGDIACGDAPPGKEGWSVDIAPISKNRKPRTLTLVNRAVSTSGDLEQFVEINGVRYSHVLDPKTGLGLTGRRSVTVIAPKGVQADSLTKAASVLPPAKALAVIDAIDGAATYIVVKDSDDADEQVTTSKRFVGYLAK
ncbi:FAD:protein FMN transferase [Fimbriiglobus ruber]|uniref:FAD:protein FMN transferase n=1 Tax=Fimbriiglobus ruber TaxID=1908690 RepID=A0A225D3D4_9BACT|nr:FAD:protein FMN transferase [Fimbriiglobus ruber]OWK36101.1 Thiamin biosynthesis lipoprotein ApbE [Fimbriiglobus ruber]